MRPIQFRYKYEGPGGAIFLKEFTLDEIEGGDHFDEISDSPLLKKYKIVARDQFTGLKDKNGKEIYEGDIVKWDDDSNGKYWRVATVNINPDLYFDCFECPSIDNSSAHGHKFHYGNFIYQDTENHLEIIGNIHENPDLLDK